MTREQIREELTWGAVTLLAAPQCRAFLLFDLSLLAWE